ncbi:hypothetical protein [Paraliomyxa miuraensis]|uniref:hypothetical protein n=1 Tax=Paraliomyxa miuraensis TaxID=376150 RepID=UPI002257EA6F|nr:hypothetical protein [Paraliomyxa miuraensis]MCX4247444.1 hypothetical protein [Paraliomyxa miuraensis]
MSLRNHEPSDGSPLLERLRRPLASLGLHLGLVGPLILPGCLPDDPYADDLDLLPPVSTRESLAYVDQARHELVVVRPEDDRLDILRRGVGDDRTTVLWSRATLDGSHVMTLVAPASEKTEDIDEQLYLFPADGEDDPQVYDVLAPFTGVALSPDGRRAVLHFGSGVGSGALQNANQVAIVPLDRAPGGEVVRNLTLNGFGGRLQSIQFPTPTGAEGPTAVDVGGRPLELVAFLAEGEVVLVDAGNELTDQVAVRFGAEVGFSPEATLLRPGDEVFGKPVLFLRSSVGSDVAMLTLVDKSDEATGEPGFSAQVSLIPVGERATDMATYNGAETPYLVTVGSSAMIFTDIRTQGSFSVGTGASVQNLFMRDAQTAAGTIKQAVAWASGGNALYTLDLDDIENTIGRTPEPLAIETGIQDLVVLDNDRVLVSSGLNLYVVDLPLSQVTPLSAQSPYDARSSALDGNRLLLGTPGQTWVSTVDLLTLNPESMVLDDAIGSFHYLPGAGKLVMVHADPVGHLTVADAQSPSRSSSYVAWGYLLDGMLDP